MGLRTSRLIKASALAVGFLMLVGFSSMSAKADEVAFGGYTNGCFNCGSAVPNSSAYQTNTLLRLSFGNSAFSSTTVGGCLGFGGNPQPVPGPQNIDNLGSFTLSMTNNTYTGNTFSLRVTFTLPPGILSGGNGGSANSQIFSATLNGAVNTLGNGGVSITFSTTPILFTFSNASGSGSFLFAVNPLSINPGQTAEITVQITSATQTAVPETATMLLLGAGVVGAAALVRWRIRKRT